MNLTLLRAFHVVAIAGGFSRAGRVLGVSQPTLSAQVKALEAAYAVSLFIRRGRGVTLTPTGQTLFAITTRLFAAEDEALSLLAGAHTLTRGHLRVAADSASHIMPLLATLKENYSGFTFSLRIGNSASVLQQILEYDADVAVMAKQSLDPRIHSMLLRIDRLVLFVPKSHVWASRDCVSIQELSGREVVFRERGSVTREIFEIRLAEANVRPSAFIEAQTREAVREAVVAGFGVGVVFESEIGEDQSVHSLRVDGANLAVEEYVICLDERRRIPLVRKFLDVAGQAAASMLVRR